MAGSATRKEKSGKKGKKRKLTSSEDTAKPSKESRKNEEGCAVEERKAPANMEVEGETTLNIKDGLQWRNLELVLLIQSKELNAHKRVELIFDFVNSRANKEENDTFQDFNILSMSQLILHTSSWIQSLLITSERKFRATNKESEESQLCLDYRCWEVLKFCLKESSRLNISLSLSRDLLKVISCVSRSALDSINSVGKDSKESIFTCMEFQFYNTVSDCIKFLFSSYGRLLNGNLDLWAVAVRSMLELLIKIYGDNLQDNDVGILMTQFSCLVLDPFSKFLRVHPGRKNGFRDFVDKLLEPLLHVLGLLHDQIRDSYPVSQQNLFKLVEETLAYGLFHSVHLDEYLSFQSTEKYSSSADGKLENTKTIIKSYHRHLFDKLEILISEKKVQALSGIGEMLRLFVDCVNKHKRDSLEAETSKLMECRSTKHHTKIGNLTSEKSDHKITASSDMRKSIINFFVLTLEPLLLDLTKHLQSDLQIETSLLDVYYVLKSVNKILSIMMHERVYVRMEGSFGEACLNFFKIIYGLLLSCHAKFNKLWQSICRVDKFPQVEIVNSLAREFILVVANFLETEYKVIGDDLVNTWLMILTLLAVAHSSTDPSLFSGTVDLGCRVLHLYSELRQVNHAVFTLCRGLRHLPFYQGDKFDKSGCLLLCSQKFRLAISNAIKSIPEGQVSGCVKTLSDEISDTLAWMKVGYSVTDEYEFGGANSCKFTTQAEIFGMVLSEIYSRVLDFLSITAGNSYLTGVSVKKLVLILRAGISHLISPEQNGGDEFLFSVTGITFQTNNEECKSYFQDKIPMFVLFFFRLYVSCRSLYRQSVSLMPPDSSRKMSAAIADFHTAYSGQDCIDRTDFEDEGYFSWIGLSSTSFLSVMQFVKGSFLQEGSTDYSCFIYVMHMMAFQRIADLDRQIQSVEYIVQTSKNVIHSKLIDDADLLSLHDNKRKQEMYLSGLKEEAVNITGFIMEYLSLVDEKQLLSMLSGRTPKISSSQYMEFDTWDLGVCTVNEKTLPIAFWWIICQNIDTWCNHATKKKLKLFLSLLILNSLPHGSCGEFEKHTRNPGDEMNVTKYQISLEHLRDTNLYDQRIVRRYIASKLCSILKKFAPLLFKDPTNIDVELSSSDWEKVLRVLNSSSRTPRDNPVTYCIYSDLIEGCCNQQTSFSPISVPVAACRSLLDLLCQMMEISLSFKSFSRCVMYLVNFERLVVRSLLDPHGTLCLHQHLELLRLLVSCRRTLKYLLMAFCEEKLEASKSLNLPIFSGSSSPTLWFLESVNLVVAWWNSLSSEYNGGQVNDMIFSLMDHTSCVFLTLSKHQFGLAIKSVQRPRSTRISSLDSRSNHSNESDRCMKSLEDVDACKSLSIVVGTLENQMKSFLLLLKEAFTSGSGEAGVQRSDLNKLCSLVSCVQGFLWGLESAVNDAGANGGDLKAKLMKRQHKTISRINNFAELFVQFIGTSSRIFLHTDQPLKISCDGLGQLNLDHDNADTCIGGLTDFGSFNHDCLRTDLLQSFLSGQNLESAFLLRGLFSACSAIVRLSMQIGCSSLPSNLIQFFLGCSEVLVVKFSGMVDMPKPLSFVWLDGTIKYLEALGGQFSSISPATTRDIYTKLVELHLKAIGRCISLQGKEATLASHDIESSAKFSQGQVSESTVSDSLYGLSDIKARLRMSFKVFIEKPSELHFLSALQALERALVGVREGCTTIYEVQMENSDGGKVSSMVAAGADCLDLILEFIKGHKQLKLVSGNLKTLTASLLNVIVHLQGPSLFYMKPNSVAVNKNPDSGSVVVMCVEVLTRVAGKPALLRLDSHHVAQSLHIPATLFQGFRNLKAGKSSHPSLLGFMDSKESEHLESSYLVDRQFSINLYAASCRLLWTVVKHHKSECVRCIALLQYSIQALLHSLEIADSADRNGYFAWQLEEGIKCASYLRRVYEEIRQQKDVLGRHCFMFLSDYIWLYSGHGPLKRGIKRELDEALRPGVYALIDVCSADDLQYLHTVFGEGPCRSTLASLQHDYKLHFQYEGKV